MKISVLMSVYFNDQLDEFKISLDSILKQSLLPNEVVIVFDGPVKSEISNYIHEKINQGYNIVLVKLEINSG